MDTTYEKLNDQNKKILNDYETYRLEVKHHKSPTVATQKLQLSKYLYFLNKDPKQATQDEIVKFLEQYKPSTQVNLLTILKPFYRRLFKLDKNDGLPDCIKEIERKQDKTDEIEYRERVISVEEYDRMIDCATGPMFRAILETLYLFGVRVSEMLSMNATDVKYDGELTTITVRNSKSIPRDVDYRGRPEHLMKYFESHQPYKEQKDKPLWVGRFGDTLTRQGVWNNITSTARKSGITRRITNHDFRHTSVTNDNKNGTPRTHIETKHGYAHGSPMMKRYDHNKSKDYQDWLKGKTGETDVTYDTLKKQKERLEQKHEKEISDLKDQIGILMEHYRELTGNGN